jgi:hypothetical protein
MQRMQPTQRMQRMQRMQRKHSGRRVAGGVGVGVEGSNVRNVPKPVGEDLLQ